MKTRVSVEADKIARKKKIGDISIYKWDDQKSRMKDPKRSLFHYEHIYPVSTLRRELEALDPPTEEAILALVSKVDIAWITKEECYKLGAHGKANDKERHEDAFATHGISFIRTPRQPVQAL